MENPPPAIPQQSPTIQPQKPSQEPPVFKPSEESKKPKNKLIPLLVFLLIVALGVAGYFGWQNYQLKLEKEVVDIQPESSPVVEVDETAEWEIYTNDKYNFQFKYPSDADIEEKNNSPAGQFIVSVESNTLNVNLDIAEIDPKGSKYYLSAGPPDETEIMNQLNWDILFNKGYCDAGQCSDPFVVWQTIKDNNRFAFIFTNEVGKTDQQVQFISTFKFVDGESETVEWKGYRSEKFGILFKHPSNWIAPSDPREGYNNPNKASGFRDECIVNYQHYFNIQDSIETHLGLISADFHLHISVTNPEKWNLETWVDKCRSYLLADSGYKTERLTINNQDFILIYLNRDSLGNSGAASEYAYHTEHNNKFYTFRFINHLYLDTGEKTVERLLETITFID